MRTRGKWGRTETLPSTLATSLPTPSLVDGHDETGVLGGSCRTDSKLEKEVVEVTVMWLGQQQHATSDGGGTWGHSQTTLLLSLSW